MTTEKKMARKAAAVGLVVGALCLASLATGSMTSAQNSSISRSDWRMFITPAPAGPLSNGHSDMSDIPPYFVDASVPDAADAAWQDAPDKDTIGFDGQVDPNFGGEQASRLTTCGSEVDYTYFETIVTVPPGTTPNTFTVDFNNIDDAAQISIFNPANPTGDVGADGIVLADNSGTQTGNLASQLVEGENRVVITQMDFCNPGNTLHEAKITLDGTEVPTEDPDSTTTTAEDGTTTTEANEPRTPVPPASFGDVHFRTPDALVFDIQDVGDFVLVQSTTGDVVIQSRQEALDIRPGVSVNTAVAMNVAGDTLEFYLNPEPTLLVNGADTDLPDGALTLPQGGVVTGSITQSTVGREETTPNDFQVDWPDGHTAARVLFKRDSHLDIGIVRLGGDLTFEGVLGNLDGDADNDMTIRDGDPVGQPATDNKVRRFADSWRVPAADSLFGQGEAPVPVAEVAEAPLAPEDLDPAVVEEAQQSCEEAGIEDPLAIETCVYDVAATGDEGFVESAATFEEAVEELPDSAPENVFATEEPDLVPDDESSFPWILVIGIAAAVLVIVAGVAYSKSSKAKLDKAAAGRAPAGAGPSAGTDPDAGAEPPSSRQP